MTKSKLTIKLFWVNIKIAKVKSKLLKKHLHDPLEEKSFLFSEDP